MPEPVPPGDSSSHGSLEVVATAVVHDLNNVFAVIANYAEFVQGEIDRLHAGGDDRGLLSLRADLAEVLAAAERGKHVVERLRTAVLRLDG